MNQSLSGNSADEVFALGPAKLSRLPPKSMSLKPASVSPAVRPDSQPVAEAVDARVVGVMRCLLALAALLIVQVSPQVAPSRPANYVLLGYCAYSITLYIFLHQRHPVLPLRGQHWLDVAFFVAMVALTGGTSSTFYHLFLFAVLVASFSRGAREGLAVTLVSVALFATVGLAVAPPWPQAELDRAVGRAIYLFLLGYMIAYWGGHEFALRRKLHLLRQISSIANARLGVDAAAADGLRRLVEFFRAESALLVLTKPRSQARPIYRVDRGREPIEFPPDDISHEMVKPLVALPPKLHAFYNAAPAWLRGGSAAFIAWEPGSDSCPPDLKRQCAELAELLEAPAFATVPYSHADGTPGRVYIVSPRERVTEADMVFLAQAVDQMMSSVSNVMLLEELGAQAAQDERSKISRDIHDTNLQAHIGLKLGLEALYRDLRGSAPAAAGRVKELLDIADLTVEDLRRYVRGLSATRAGQYDTKLASNLNEQARRYRDYHGIDVVLKCDAPEQMSQTTGAEACHIVSEALSNVLRHTTAKHAYVDVRCEGASLAIEIGNVASPEQATVPFVPRSISERALALGGQVQVRLNKEGHDIVRATIPLRPNRGARGAQAARPAAA